MKFSELDNPEDSSAVAEQAPATKTPEPRPRSKPAAVTSELSVDRLPPHSLDAELGVLGCMMLDPERCISDCIERFNAGADVFYDLKHQVLYETLVAMFSEVPRKGIDVITLHQRLKDIQQLEACGGLDYIAPLPDKVPSAANLKFYQDIVQEKYVLRMAVRLGTDIVARVHESEGDVETFIDGIERDALAIRNGIVNEAQQYTIKQLVHESINRFDSYLQNQGKPLGISYGFPDLDRMTMGLRGGDMIVIAARPSVGKTSLAMNIAEAVAVDQKLPVGVFSLEMSKESLVDRMICSRGRINIREATSGYFAERDFPKITTAAGKIANSPLHIDDTSGLSILQLRSRARNMWQKFGIKLFVIDYLQLLHSKSKQAQFSREREISEISSGIKGMAKDLGIPVIVLAQLNRSIEKEKGRRPRMSDLRESGAIEQDADLIGMLYKQATDDDTPEDQSETTMIDLDITKQRNGPVGTVHFTFLKKYTRFESVSRIADDGYQPPTRDD